ncbi:hypothetical protein MHU86_1352 [Fragilaria crotonensis]|nr:hypothetical protein MHU86_1352 [Fragilaria crotonensis]
MPPTRVPIAVARISPDPTIAPPSSAPIADTSASPKPTTTMPPTPAPNTGAALTSTPTFLTPELIACKFLSIPNATECRLRETFDAYNYGDRTTGYTIPSEIGLLTQLKVLHFWDNKLNSTIPTEFHDTN